jgi:hypothetical protein
MNSSLSNVLDVSGALTGAVHSMLTFYDPSLCADARLSVWLMSQLHPHHNIIRYGACQERDVILFVQGNICTGGVRQASLARL